jgi:ribosomal peptide maturation radical SAM protein 1
MGQLPLVQLAGINAKTKPRERDGGNPVALINMPWASLQYGSIALGILKAELARYHIGAEVFYFNLRFARLMKKSLSLFAYAVLSQFEPFGEWIFSQHLFGKYGSGELDNSDLDAVCDPGLRKIIERNKIDLNLINERIIPKFIDDCLSDVKWEKYRIVGFTSTFTQQLASLLLARRIKEKYPDVKIVFGGANVHSVMGKSAIAAFDWIDYVVDGEAEEAFPDLVSNILDDEPYRPVKGVSFRKNGEVILHTGPTQMVAIDKSPVPDYTDYYNELTASGMQNDLHVSLLFESSRGCWWGEKAHCTFCGLNGQTMKYRSKSPGAVANEILDQSAKYNTLFVQAVDNILDEDYIDTFLTGMAKQQIDLQLFYEVKSNLTRSQVSKLAEARVTHIQPGIESLHTDVLKLMRKGVTAGQNVQLLKHCREYRIQVTWNLLYGFPGETAAHYQEILNTISLITHLQPPSQAIKLILQRYSPYYVDPDRFGIRDVSPMSIYDRIYPRDKVKIDDVAYYFDYSLDQSQADPETYIKPIRRAFHLWHSGFSKREIFFKYSRGEGFLELYDNRPLSLKAVTEPLRRTVLTGNEYLIYLFCDSLKGFKDVCDHLRTVSDDYPGDDEIRLTLDGLVARRLMYSEKNKFLSLAVPMSIYT